MSLNLVFSRSWIYPRFLLLLSLFALILCVLFFVPFSWHRQCGGGNAGASEEMGEETADVSSLLFCSLFSPPFSFSCCSIHLSGKKRRRGKGRDVHFSPGLQIGAKFGSEEGGKKEKCKLGLFFLSQKKKALGTKYQGWAYREIREGGKL